MRIYGGTCSIICPPHVMCRKYASFMCQNMFPTKVPEIFLHNLTWALTFSQCRKCSYMCRINASCKVHRKSCEVLTIPVLCRNISYTDVQCLLYVAEIPTPGSTSYRVQEKFLHQRGTSYRVQEEFLRQRGTSYRVQEKFLQNVHQKVQKTKHLASVFRFLFLLEHVTY